MTARATTAAERMAVWAAKRTEFSRKLWVRAIEHACDWSLDKAAALEQACVELGPEAGLAVLLRIARQTLGFRKGELWREYVAARKWVQCKHVPVGVLLDAADKGGPVDYLDFMPDFPQRVLDRKIQRLACYRGHYPGPLIFLCGEAGPGLTAEGHAELERLRTRGDTVAHPLHRRPFRILRENYEIVRRRCAEQVCACGRGRHCPVAETAWRRIPRAIRLRMIAFVRVASYTGPSKPPARYVACGYEVPT